MHVADRVFPGAAYVADTPHGVKRTATRRCPAVRHQTDLRYWDEYPFASNFVHDLPALRGLRLHYLDEGAHRAQMCLLLVHDSCSELRVFAAPRSRLRVIFWFG